MDLHDARDKGADSKQRLECVPAYTDAHADNEVFFGPVTEREQKVASRYKKRRTEMYIVGGNRRNLAELFRFERDDGDTSKCGSEESDSESQTADAPSMHHSCSPDERGGTTERTSSMSTSDWDSSSCSFSHNHALLVVSAASDTLNEETILEKDSKRVSGEDLVRTANDDVEFENDFDRPTSVQVHNSSQSMPTETNTAASLSTEASAVLSSGTLATSIASENSRQSDVVSNADITSSNDSSCAASAADSSSSDTSRAEDASSAVVGRASKTCTNTTVSFVLNEMVSVQAVAATRVLGHVGCHADRACPAIPEAEETNLNERQSDDLGTDEAPDDGRETSLTTAEPLKQRLEFNVDNEQKYAKVELPSGVNNVNQGGDQVNRLMRSEMLSPRIEFLQNKENVASCKDEDVVDWTGKEGGNATRLHIDRTPRPALNPNSVRQDFDIKLKCSPASAFRVFSSPFSPAKKFFPSLYEKTKDAAQRDDDFLSPAHRSPLVNAAPTHIEPNACTPSLAQTSETLSIRDDGVSVAARVSPRSAFFSKIFSPDSSAVVADSLERDVGRVMFAYPAVTVCVNDTDSDRHGDAAVDSCEHDDSTHVGRVMFAYPAATVSVEDAHDDTNRGRSDDDLGTNGGRDDDCNTDRCHGDDIDMDAGRSDDLGLDRCHGGRGDALGDEIVTVEANDVFDVSDTMSQGDDCDGDGGHAWNVPPELIPSLSSLSCSDDTAISSSSSTESGDWAPPPGITLRVTSDNSRRISPAQSPGITLRVTSDNSQRISPAQSPGTTLTSDNSQRISPAQSPGTTLTSDNSRCISPAQSPGITHASANSRCISPALSLGTHDNSQPASASFLSGNGRHAGTGLTIEAGSGGSNSFTLFPPLPTVEVVVTEHGGLCEPTSAEMMQEKTDSADNQPQVSPPVCSPLLTMLEKKKAELQRLRADREKLREVVTKKKQRKGPAKKTPIKSEGGARAFGDRWSTQKKQELDGIGMLQLSSREWDKVVIWNTVQNSQAQTCNVAEDPALLRKTPLVIRHAPAVDGRMHPTRLKWADELVTSISSMCSPNDAAPSCKSILIKEHERRTKKLLLPEIVLESPMIMKKSNTLGYDSPQNDTCSIPRAVENSKLPF
ncbi:PREDICTED: uncharacterized protein LOC106805092 [Priapulus caudatus]|uniref:Uncharacterized protein LOC106805092 n=1 Tax=Priapulus caudatus TaxID=37621 RepID=A0ABM1DQ36_PRICU|nr:PREDICTED: uncharacterized protein LOC106805092 [Priapulus caudatus]